MIIDSPLLGMGYNGFEENYMVYQAKYLKDKPIEESYLAGDNRYAFNLFIRIAVEFGIIGLILFAIFLLYLFTLPSRIEGIKYKSLLLGWLTFSMFSYPEYSFYLNVIFIFVLAGLSGTSKKGNVEINIRRPIIFICLIGAMALTIFIGYGLLKIDQSFKSDSNANIEGTCKGYYQWIKNDGDLLSLYGQVLIRNSKHEEAIPILKKSIQYLPNSESYLNLGICYAKVGEYKKAINSFDISAAMVPARFKPGLHKVKTLLEMGHTGEAKILASSLLNKKVKVMSIEVYEILEELKKIVEE